MEVSAEIYGVYLRYISPEDIHVYSIDECFIYATPYLNMYGMHPKQLAQELMDAVFRQTHITATAGVATNLFLAKIALDITAKHVPDHIGWLDEDSFRKRLWHHRPITDFWNIGAGTARRLEKYGVYDLCGVAQMDENILYREFGVNAQFLIDHANGREPCTIADIHAYEAKSHSISNGQILFDDYNYDDALLVMKEMADTLALELVDKELVTDQVVLTVGYDIENLRDPSIRGRYHGEVKKDHYGRMVPKHAHGTANLPTATSSTKEILEAVTGLYEEIVNPLLFVRRISLTANKVVSEKDVTVGQSFEQLDLITDYAALEVKKKEVQEERNREKSVQKAVLDIKKKYGKNALLKGMSLIEGATAVARNRQIGGHKA